MAVTAAAATKKLFAPAMPVFYGQLSTSVAAAASDAAAAAAAATTSQTPNVIDYQ